MNLCFGKQYEVCSNADPKHVANKNAEDTEKESFNVVLDAFRSPSNDKQILDDCAQRNRASSHKLHICDDLSWVCCLTKAYLGLCL